MKKGLFNLFTKAVFATLCIVMSNDMVAQKYKPKTKCLIGGGIEAFSTGNWHGAYFSPYLSLSHGRRSFNAGPLIQSEKKELNGGKLSFSYNLSGGKKSSVIDDEDDNEAVVKENNNLLQLNFFSFAQYISNARLSHSASITEQKVAKENLTDWSNVRLSTAEAGVGFELYVKFSKRISWKSYVGGSVYYHTNYIAGMYQERFCPALVLGTGIHICPL